MPLGVELLIFTERTGKEISIKIKDNGIGMTKEQLVRVGELIIQKKGQKARVLV